MSETVVCKRCQKSYARWGDPWDTWYCPSCHEQQFARSPRHVCLLCGERKLYYHFIWEFQGYFVRDFFFCCSNCEGRFNLLSQREARLIIQQALRRHYKPGQVVYTLHESDTGQIRYVGRTYNPKDRIKKHFRQAWPFSYEEALKGAYVRQGKIEYERPVRDPARPVHYTEGPWLYDLFQREAEPIMTIVEQVEDAPLIVERELLWMCHLTQADFRLVNTCAYIPEFVVLVNELGIDFLHDHVPTEMLSRLGRLAQQGAHHSVFIRHYYCDEP